MATPGHTRLDRDARQPPRRRAELTRTTSTHTGTTRPGPHPEEPHSPPHLRTHRPCQRAHGSAHPNVGSQHTPGHARPPRHRHTNTDTPLFSGSKIMAPDSLPLASAPTWPTGLPRTPRLPVSVFFTDSSPVPRMGAGIQQVLHTYLWKMGRSHMHTGAQPDFLPEPSPMTS